MPRHPEWFERLDSIEASLAQAATETLGRTEMEALFGASERDAIRLLHKFGAREQANALSLERTSLLAQLDAVRRGGAYTAFTRQRQNLAQQLAQARSESAARHFRVRSVIAEEKPPGLDDLPATVTWRREKPDRPGRFSIDYDNGEDLMWQLAEFLAAASRDRASFFRGTEPGENTTP